MLYFVGSHVLYCLIVFFYSIYSVKPAKALIKGDSMTFIVKCSPTEVKTYKHNLLFRLNDNEKYNKV